MFGVVGRGDLLDGLGVAGWAGSGALGVLETAVAPEHVCYCYVNVFLVLKVLWFLFIKVKDLFEDKY